MMRVLRLLLALLTLLAITILVQRWHAIDDTAAPERGLDAIGHVFEGLPPSLSGATLAIGLLLFGSWMLGRAFKAMRLPRLSGYLVFGMLVGPEALGIITQAQIPNLRLAESLAISLIALTAGGEMELDYLKRAIKLIVSISFFQMAAVFVVVALIVYALAPSIGLVHGENGTIRVIASLIAATLATANSPAVFIAVMNEIRARGQGVQTGMSVVIFIDLALIVLFTIVIATSTAVLDSTAGPAAEIEQGISQVEESIDAELTTEEAPESAPTNTVTAVAGTLTIHLIGSVVVGVIIGLAFAWYMHAIHDHLGIFVVCGCLSIAYISQIWHLEALIVALVAGILMRNVWHERVGPFFQKMEDLSLPVYCIFFAVAGAKLNLSVLAVLWPATLAVVSGRAVAIWAGTQIGCKVGGLKPPVNRWLWMTFLPQAGVAVALASIVSNTFEGHAFAEALYTLFLSCIAIHELVGPLVTKWSLQKLDALAAESEPETSA